MDNLGKISWREIVFHVVPWFCSFVLFPAVPQVSYLRSSFKESAKEKSSFLQTNSEKMKGHLEGAHSNQAAEGMAGGRAVLQETQWRSAFTENLHAVKPNKNKFFKSAFMLCIYI